MAGSGQIDYEKDKIFAMEVCFSCFWFYQFQFDVQVIDNWLKTCSADLSDAIMIGRSKYWKWLYFCQKYIPV